MLAFRSIISLSDEGKVFFYFISNSDDFFQTDVCFGAAKLILCEFFFFIIILEFPIYLKNRFQVAVRLFSNRSQMVRCGKNKKVAHEVQPSVPLMFLPHFDVLCHL